MTKNTNQTFSPVPDRDGLEARFGVRVAAMLGERAQATAPDISERLRFAREQGRGGERFKQAWKRGTRQEALRHSRLGLRYSAKPGSV